MNIEVKGGDDGGLCTSMLGDFRSTFCRGSLRGSKDFSADGLFAWSLSDLTLKSNPFTRCQTFRFDGRTSWLCLMILDFDELTRSIEPL